MTTDSKNPLITVCIVHFNDSDFVLNSLYCLEKLTKNSYRVIIRDNNSKIHLFQKLIEGIKNYKNVYLYRVENFNLTGSLAHGTALNDIVAKIDTPYGVILDADCTFLIKSWDEILISELRDKIKIIGTPAPAGSPKPKDFPLMYAILFETKTLKELNIDFRPKDLSKFQDSGWELREKYLKAGFQGKILKMKSTRNYKRGPFKDIICGEYYLDGYSQIFASHFGRGATLGVAKYKGKIYKIPILGKYLLQRKGREEKQKWIKICRAITHS